ncbi:hypothetical protein [Phormidium nigroviride]
MQPYAGSPLAEVVEYLKSLDVQELNRLVGEMLVISLLPRARFYHRHSNTDKSVYTPEQLRQTCLESCNALALHASSLRQELMVEQPPLGLPYLMGTVMLNNGHLGQNGMHDGNGNGVVGVVSADQIEGEEEVESEASVELIEGEGDWGDAEQLFGFEGD